MPLHEALQTHLSHLAQGTHPHADKASAAVQIAQYPQTAAFCGSIIRPLKR